MIKSIDIGIVKAIRRMDRVLVLSTATNLTMLFIKIVEPFVGFLLSFVHLVGYRNTWTFTYIREKSFSECLWLLLPYSGNVYIHKHRKELDWKIAENNVELLLLFLQLNEFPFTDKFDFDKREETKHFVNFFNSDKFKDAPYDLPEFEILRKHSIFRLEPLISTFINHMMKIDPNVIKHAFILHILTPKIIKKLGTKIFDTDVAEDIEFIIKILKIRPKLMKQAIEYKTDLAYFEKLFAKMEMPQIEQCLQEGSENAKLFSCLLNHPKYSTSDFANSPTFLQAIAPCLEKEKCGDFLHFITKENLEKHAALISRLAETKAKIVQFLPQEVLQDKKSVRSLIGCLNMDKAEILNHRTNPLLRLWVSIDPSLQKDTDIILDYFKKDPKSLWMCSGGWNFLEGFNKIGDFCSPKNPELFKKKELIEKYLEFIVTEKKLEGCEKHLLTLLDLKTNALSHIPDPIKKNKVQILSLVKAVRELAGKHNKKHEKGHSSMLNYIIPAFWEGIDPQLQDDLDFNEELIKTWDIFYEKIPPLRKKELIKRIVKWKEEEGTFSLERIAFLMDYDRFHTEVKPEGNEDYRCFQEKKVSNQLQNEFESHQLFVEELNKINPKIMYWIDHEVLSHANFITKFVEDSTFLNIVNGYYSCYLNYLRNNYLRNTNEFKELKNRVICLSLANKHTEKQTELTKEKKLKLQFPKGVLNKIHSYLWLAHHWEHETKK